MAWNVNRHGIVVQRIANRSSATCGTDSSPQSLIADQRSARDRFELVQDLLLERITDKSQINMMTQRIGRTSEIAVNLLADCRDNRSILNRIELQSQL